MNNITVIFWKKPHCYHELWNNNEPFISNFNAAEGTLQFLLERVSNGMSCFFASQLSRHRSIAIFARGKSKRSYHIIDRHFSWQRCRTTSDKQQTYWASPLVSNIFASLNLTGKVILAVAIISWLRENVFDLCPAVGQSMQPVIEGNGDLLVFERFCYRLHRWGKQFTLFPPMRKGDIVIAFSGVDQQIKVCKRITALPGDLVLVPFSRHQQFARPLDVVKTQQHGTELVHYFPTLASPEEDDRLQLCRIPPDHVWLQGDNCKESFDSRHYGPVPTAFVVGRVICRIWPIWNARWFGEPWSRF